MPKRKKRRTHVRENPEAQDKIPKSFVFRKGEVGWSVKDLVSDVRKAMEPHTAVNLKEKKSNSLKDFAHVAGPLGVSHFLMFSATDVGTYMRLIKLAHGPTLTFKVHSYSLATDVIKLQKRPLSVESAYLCPPLLVMNRFTGDENHIKLMNITFQNMFSPINVKSVKLADCRRVILLDYDPDTKKIQFRHFAIVAKPSGVSKAVKKLLGGDIPSMNKFDDVADFMMDQSGYGTSDSEGEQDPTSRVTLAQNYVGRGNKASSQVSVKVQELGPRMEIQLMKIEDDFAKGNVVYHEYIKKTPQEVEALKKKAMKAKAEKAQRKKIQEDNVKRKQAEKEAKEKRKAERDTTKNVLQAEDDDDVAYYKEAVGEEPEDGILAQDSGKKQKFNPLYKKRKRDKDGDRDDAKKDKKGKFNKGSASEKGGRGKDNNGKKWSGKVGGSAKVPKGQKSGRGKGGRK